MVSAWDSSADDEVNAAAMNLAARSLSEVGAVREKLDDDNVLDLDVSDLIGGAGVTMQWLVESLAAVTPMDRLEVIARARRFVDTGE